MAAAYQDQYMEQGATFNLEINLDDDTGAPLNLNGYTIESKAKRSYYSANATIVFNTTITDAANGVVRIYADANTTSNVPYGKLVYDVLVTETNNNTKIRVLEGTILVSPSVTN